MTEPNIPQAVFAPPAETSGRRRMRRAHERAALVLSVSASGPEAWGWNGRTLGRRAGQYWLRLVSAPADRRNARLWDGTAAADSALPRSVPRPRLRDVTEWTEDTIAYRAELSEYIARPALQTGGPILTADVDLPQFWWDDLRKALAATATVPTDRQAVRQQWIDRNFTRFLGIPAPTIDSWTTGHGDLHWGNLTPHPLVLLDWEGWGRLPTGYDVGLLHAYTLTRPATAARIRSEYAHILDTPEGRLGELVALAQLLQVTARGAHPELAPHLARRAQHLTGTPVPAVPLRA
ncbi:hypothetical protein [Streptomyces sp. NPDC047014]|uniref:hypothetical protein n=1 Tax=Streptomyces sp. NPDC047014 TaxID=3155736 RepID=UPI0033F20B1D